MGKRKIMLRSKDRKNMNFVQKVWRLMAPFHRAFYFILAITAVFETVRMGGPFLFGKILDLLIKTGGQITFETALYILGGLAGVRLVSLVIDYLTDMAIVRLLWTVERYISTASFSKLLELSLDYHEKESTGSKISIVSRGKDKLMELVSAFTWEFQPIVLQLLVTSIMIFVLSWQVGLVFSLSIIPFLLITFRTYRSTTLLRSRRHDAYETSSGELGDIISNITVVKAFAQEKREREAFTSIWDLIKDLSVREFKRRHFASFGRSLIVEIFFMTLLIIGIMEIKQAALTVGSLVFLINLIERAYSNVYRLGRVYDRAVDASESVDRISSLMGKTATIVNLPGALVPDRIEGQLSFRHVTFAYNKRRILKNVSFTVPAGSFTALVGRSGAGKSTVAKLISRYYDPTRGAILIDGKYDLRNLDLDAFRSSTAVVFQDSPVPNRKIWEIISYAAGKKNFNEVREEVLRAAKLASADEFISEFPEGYETEVGERGVRLSGGQKQRLAIARALFAKPKILIMDEPTSHLDTLSEGLIQEALRKLSEARTLTKIIIAHRLSTVQKADQILVMERGTIVERGTHAELMKKEGVYASIVHQSELKG